MCVGAIIAVQAAGATISSAAEEGLTGTAIQQPAALAGGMRTPAAVRVPVANPRMKFSFGNMSPPKFNFKLSTGDAKNKFSFSLPSKPEEAAASAPEPDDTTRASVPAPLGLGMVPTFEWGDTLG